MVRSRNIAFLLQAIGLVATVCFSSIASAGDPNVLPLDRVQFRVKIDQIAQQKGLRFSFGSNAFCDNVEKEGVGLYYCRSGFGGADIYLWSRARDAYGPLLLVSLRVPTSRYVAADRLVLGLSLVIATIDTQLTEDEVQNIAERLASAGRTLSGQVAITAKVGTYEARVDHDGLLIKAFRSAI